MNYFAYPSMFGWLMIVAALGILSAALARRRRRALAAFSSGHGSAARLLPSSLAYRRRWIASCRLAGLLCLTVALAGPLIGSKLVEFRQKGLDVFIALDTSLSMQAEDFKPNRMAHAKLALAQLIERLPGSRIGIIAFAGNAAVQCPLTIDAGAARQVLDAIDVGAIPTPGTSLGSAIRLAIRGMKAGEGGPRVLILLTDGENTGSSDPLAAAKEAADVGLRIYPIGIGSPQGEPIPVLDANGHRTGYKRDKKGDVVLSRLGEQTLADIAGATKGRSVRADPTGAEVDDVVRDLDGLQHGDQKTQLFNRYENRFQWPLALGILLLMISLAIPERPRTPIDA